MRAPAALKRANPLNFNPLPGTSPTQTCAYQCLFWISDGLSNRRFGYGRKLNLPKGAIVPRVGILQSIAHRQHCCNASGRGES